MKINIRIPIQFIFIFGVLGSIVFPFTFLSTSCTKMHPVNPYDSIPVVIIDTTAGAEIDLSTVTGQPTYCASGFLWSLSYDEPHDSLLLPLKVQLFRSRITPWQGQTGLGSILRMAEIAPRIQIVLSDEYNLRFPYKPPPSNAGSTSFFYSNITSWPGDNGDYSLWEDVIEEAYLLFDSKGIDVEWDLWEEPNWHGWWAPSQQRFFEAWKVGVQKLKSLDPDAVIVGPSVSGFKEQYLKDFLYYAKEHDVLPDVISWHEIHNNHNPTEIPGNVETMKGFMAEKGINIEKFDINEVVAPKWQTNPGVHVWYIANMEEAGIYGACKATWRDEDEDVYNAGVPTLGGFLNYPDLSPRPTWWVMKAYADITGNLVKVTPDSTMEGVAGIDDETQEVRILLGRYKYGSDDDVVKIRKLQTVSWLSGLDSVHVVVNHIPNKGWEPLASPVELLNGLVEVQRNTVRLNFKEFDQNDALEIIISTP